MWMAASFSQPGYFRISFRTNSLNSALVFFIVAKVLVLSLLITRFTHSVDTTSCSSSTERTERQSVPPRANNGDQASGLRTITPRKLWNKLAPYDLVLLYNVHAHSPLAVGGECSPASRLPRPVFMAFWLGPGLLVTYRGVV